VSSALATQPEARGDALPQQTGRSAGAVPVLTRAVAAIGANLRACLEPASQTCLTYADPLCDLGRALRSSGNPAATAPILERRLRLAIQRTIVATELEVARETG
jgi:hypothetical protein